MGSAPLTGPTITGSYAIIGSGGQFTWSVQSNTAINGILITVPTSIFLTSIDAPSGWNCGNNSTPQGTIPYQILCSGPTTQTNPGGTIGYSPADSNPAPIQAAGSIGSTVGPAVTLTPTG